jgi:geranylgeranyl diphosphate synthase type II
MFKAYCKAKLPLIDEALQKAMTIEGEIAPTIFDSMRYSLFAGGKRLRPVLLLAAADAVGADGNKFLNVACGLEMIHTYSLIHDDLPAMDNDDYRRGKLTNHKVYGEGIAVLAGDSLLTYAFETMLSQEGVEPKTLLKVVKEIASAAGPEGMVGGQVIDMESEGKAVSLDTLQQMHRAKTGALFRAAVRAGAILGGASDEEVEALTVYAEKFGLAFQITDDILDVIGTAEAIGKPVGSDLKNNKSTYVTLHSVEIAQQMAKETVDDAIEALAMFGERGAVLKDLVEYLLKRES